MHGFKDTESQAAISAVLEAIDFNAQALPEGWAQGYLLSLAAAIRDDVRVANSPLPSALSG